MTVSAGTTTEKTDGAPATGILAPIVGVLSQRIAEERSAHTAPQTDAHADSR